MYPFRLGIKEQDYKPKKQIGFTVSNLMRNANGTLNKLYSVKNIKRKKFKLIQILIKIIIFKIKYIMQDYNEAIEEQFVAQQGVFELIEDFKIFYDAQKLRKNITDKKKKK